MGLLQTFHLLARDGGRENVLDRPVEYYGFVSSITPDVDLELETISGDLNLEAPDGEELDEVDPLDEAPGRWLVDFECVEAEWFDRVWGKELPRRLTEMVESVVGGGFEEAFVTAGREVRELLYGAHAAYMERSIEEGDPAPVALLHLVIDPDEWGRKEIRETEWFRFHLGPPEGYVACGRMKEAPTWVGVFTELALPPGEDGAPVMRRVVRMRRPEGPMAEVLRAVHFPQLPVGGTTETETGEPSEPMGGGGKRGVDIGGEEQEAKRRRFPFEESGGGPIEVFAGLGERLAEGWRRLVDWMRPPDGMLAPAGWPGGWGLPGADGRAPVVAAHQMYVGAPSNNNVIPVVARMANPMAAAGGPQQPMVAVLNVGQGNSNQLCDQNHKVICYYDYGSPLHNYLGTAPNVRAGCLHDDPLLVLSHWDYDHYGMARRNTYAYKLRWIVPQQHMGSAASRDVYARIPGAGGQIRLWAGAAGNVVPPAERFALPGGFLQRGVIRRQLGGGSHQMNDGGIVMYVCVDDGGQAGVGAGPVWPAALQGRVAPVPSLAVIAGGMARGAAVANVMAQDIAQAAMEAVTEAAEALGIAPIVANTGPTGAAADVAQGAWLVVGNWEDVWGALQGIVGGNYAAGGANRVGLPMVAGPVGQTCRAAFAANALFLGGANLNAVAPGGRNHTYEVVAAAAITDATMARMAVGGNLGAARAAARLAMREVMRVHIKAVLPAVAPLGYPPMAPIVGVATVPAAVVAAAAVFHPAERYVLLTGDVGVNYIPAQAGVARPLVVGMTPTHHGARTCFPHTGSQLKQVEALCRLPWAPGSAAARAAHVARLAAEDGTFLLTDTDNVKAAIVAAAAAYALAEIGLGVGGVVGAPNWAHLANAATSVINNASNSGRRNLGRMGGLTVGAAGTALRANLGGGAVTARAAVAAARLGLALTQGGQTNINLAAAVVVADTAYVVSGVGLGNVNLEHLALQEALAAARAMRFALNNPPPALWVVPGAVAARTVGLVGGNYAQVPSASIQAAVRGWRAVQAATNARRPALLAEASRSGVQAGAAAGVARSGRVAYSYGVTAAGGHLYPSGGFGHPHPMAVLAYEARGWNDRFNTPATAHTSNQPYATAPPGAGARGNPIALGWETGVPGPLTGGGGRTIVRTGCPLCARVVNNC